jgi:hypothetical protein
MEWYRAVQMIQAVHMAQVHKLSTEEIAGETGFPKN